MNAGKVVVGFIGAGGIARAHAYALNSLRYYYNDVPDLVTSVVCSATEKSRRAFAERFGFRRSCDPEEFFADTAVDTVYILGPNNVHFRHLKDAAGMPSVKRIYLEKPVCSGQGEMESIASLAAANPQVRIQVGFQFLFSSSVREALSFWKSGKLGKPLHFEVKYYHGDYLDPEYRAKRKSRLTPAPGGGAMADLGSHAISLLMAFLGEKLKITGAVQAGSFEDVPEESDLFSLIALYDETSGAAGTVASSRVSSGTRDSLSIALYAESGALKYSSDTADYFEYYTGDSGKWHRQYAGSNYRPVTSFPSGHVPAGWLRAMVHAHYVFLTDTTGEAIIPGIGHGLAVQRLVNETALHLEAFRRKTAGYLR